MSPAAPAADLPRASVADTLAVLGEVLLPLVARGVIVRRPPVVAAAERLGLDERAVRRVQRLRRRYGRGPLLLRLPVRDLALVLDPDDVHRVLGATPAPFTPANLEKRAALGHFQPEGVLISTGAERAERRAYNEAVLDADRPMHRMADTLVTKAREEAVALRTEVGPHGTLTWDAFIAAWFRVVRRVVFGDRARDDEAVTDLVHELRADANWSYLKPKRRDRRERFLGEVRRHLDRAEPGSLAALMAATPRTDATEPAQQVPQWLFAFDPAGMAAYRALALLAAHPEQARSVREELAGLDLAEPHELPLLRAAVLESLRLWPTTPAVLRDTTEPTALGAGTLPAGAGVLVFAPFFHRDDERLPHAHRFAPGLWLHQRTEQDWPLVPFSAGPGICPGRWLVLLTTTTFLAALLEDRTLALTQPERLDPTEPLPGTLSPFDLSFASAPLG